MRITIFGGTGPTGRLLVEDALAAGSEVTYRPRRAWMEVHRDGPRGVNTDHRLEIPRVAVSSWSTKGRLSVDDDSDLPGPGIPSFSG